MQLSDLYRWAETVVPEADEVVIPSESTTQLCKRDIFNEAEREFVKLTKCLPKDKKFDCVANNSTYSLVTEIPDFLEFKEEGVWHFRSDSSTTIWDRMKPTTRRVLDQKYKNWRSHTSSDYCRNYWQDGDEIGIYYTPTSTVTNGFWAYYYATSSQMSTSTDYPFTGAINSTRLEPYHKHLLVYYEYRALGILGYKQDAQAKLKEFYLLCEQSKSEMQERSDLAQEAQVRPYQARRSFNA